MSHETLTLILPVQDAQHQLSHSVTAALEAAAELCARFELIVIDDGSTDDTEEVARDLAVCYPQLQVARHSRRRGISDSINTAMMATSGEIVIVQPINQPPQPAEIRRLWQIGMGYRLAGEVDKASEEGMIARLLAWGQAMRQSPRALRPAPKLIRRRQYRQDESPSRFLPNRVDGFASALPLGGPNFLNHVRNFTLGE